MIKRKIFYSILLSTLFIVACGPKKASAPVVGEFTTEQIARGVLVKLAAFNDTAKSNHPECSADKPETATKGICPALHTSIDVQNTLGKTINLYCAGIPINDNEPYGKDINGDGITGPCAPIISIEPKLNDVLAQAFNIISQGLVAKIKE